MEFFFVCTNVLGELHECNFRWRTYSVRTVVRSHATRAPANYAFFERLSANYATRCPIFDRIQLLWTVVVTSAVLLSQQCCHPHPVQQNNTLQYTTTVRYVLCASRSPFPSTPIQKRKSVPNVRVDRQQLVAYGKVFTVVFQSVCTLRPLHLPQKQNILA
jgi:hypothetical protein